jgi:hypothetical protein
MKLNNKPRGLFIALGIIMPIFLFSASITAKQQAFLPTNEGAAAASLTPAADMAAREQSQDKLKGIQGLKALITSIQNIGSIFLTLFSFGDLSSGINKTTVPLFAIIDEFNKEKPDINVIIKNLHAMKDAQPLILKDVERIVKVLVMPLTVFSPLVVKSLEKKGKVIVKNGVKMIEIQKCVAKTINKEITQDGKKFSVPQQTIETVKELVPAKDATKHIVDFAVCQVFKLINSYYQLIYTVLGYATKFSGVSEKKSSTKPSPAY